MHINLSKQALTDELGEPALTQQIMCTADLPRSDGAALGAGRLASNNQAGEAPTGCFIFQSSFLASVSFPNVVSGERMKFVLSGSRQAV